jgi:hypothetical protein
VRVSRALLVFDARRFHEDMLGLVGRALADGLLTGDEDMEALVAPLVEGYLRLGAE